MIIKFDAKAKNILIIYLNWLFSPSMRSSFDPKTDLTVMIFAQNMPDNQRF